MKGLKRVTSLIKKISRGTAGFLCAIHLNYIAVKARFSSSKVVVFQFHAANQLPHIEPVIEMLCKEPYSSQLSIVILLHPDEIANAKSFLNKYGDSIRISTHYSTSFLLFWDAVIALDQRMRLPIINAWGGLRLCMFHGQPTKGNVYSGFNYRRLDGLFFYGPMMRDYYFDKKALHPEWPMIRSWDIGQPKTDILFTEHRDRSAARETLGLDPTLRTVIYAPSFEYCASLAKNGEEIIGALVSTGYNVIIKPHPAFYRIVNKDDEYFWGVPYAEEWRVRADALSRSGKVVFPIDVQIDTKLALEAADVLITDHSGIAFEALLLDMPVIYFDCPEFFDEYLPERFEVDGDKARKDIACNAGRSAGVVVMNVRDLITALNNYVEDPILHAAERQQLRDNLLFNQGHATDEFVKTLRRLME